MMTELSAILSWVNTGDHLNDLSLKNNSNFSVLVKEQTCTGFAKLMKIVFTTENEMELTFEDALRIARGCTDYGGGYRGNAEQYDIYQHGIQTVINALTDASKTGLEDMQTRALHTIGAND
jgi:hypothetical protein